MSVNPQLISYQRIISFFFVVVCRRNNMTYGGYFITTLLSQGCIVQYDFKFPLNIGTNDAIFLMIWEGDKFLKDSKWFYSSKSHKQNIAKFVRPQN